jgi:hypothetical protein
MSITVSLTKPCQCCVIIVSNSRSGVKANTHDSCGTPHASIRELYHRTVNTTRIHPLEVYALASLVTLISKVSPLFAYVEEG